MKVKSMEAELKEHIKKGLCKQPAKNGRGYCKNKAVTAGYCMRHLGIK